MKRFLLDDQLPLHPGMFPATEIRAANRELSFFVSGEFNSYQLSFWKDLVNIKFFDSKSMILINGNSLDNHFIPFVNCYCIRVKFVIFGLNCKYLHFVDNE